MHPWSAINHRVDITRVPLESKAATLQLLFTFNRYMKSMQTPTSMTHLRRLRSGLDLGIKPDRGQFDFQLDFWNGMSAEYNTMERILSATVGSILTSLVGKAHNFY